MQSSGAANIGINDANELQASENGMRSVLEIDDLTDFLAKAELANREFSSEREQFVVTDNVAQQVVVGGQAERQRKVQWDESVLSDESDEDSYAEEQRKKQLAYDIANTFNFRELAVPRRPKWDHTTTPEQLDQYEKEAFLNWRRAIAMKEEQIMSSLKSSSTGGSASSNSMNISVTPFEKNIQVWRQLWRVIERSDCIVLVVDGRNPLFYLSMDLRTYVEKELNKSLIVVVNKCDYLTEKQRLMWHQYFMSLDGLEHVFFSAVIEQQILDDAGKYGDNGDDADVVHVDHSDDDDSKNDNDKDKDPATTTNLNEDQKDEEDDNSNTHTGHTTVLNPKTIGIQKPLARKELLNILCKYAELRADANDSNIQNTTPASTKNKSSRLEFGMVGFPNVGKSSVLNVLVGASKNDHKTSRVGVASQPGKTKHFQTLIVPDYENITLCDCPGLVFPSFVSSSADLVLAGVYPLSQARDYWPAVELICRRIPREILEVHFGIELPRPSVLDIAERGGDRTLHPPTAEELLHSYCIVRSLLSSNSGVPDYFRASRVVLKDYVMGNILYCHCPPKPVVSSANNGEDDAKWEVKFHRETLSTVIRTEKKLQDKFKLKISDGKDEGNQNNNGEGSPEIDDDLDIFDIIGGVDDSDGQAAMKGNGGNRGKKHKSMHKWGKKGRKNRNKDPYGCHTEPDDKLLGGKREAGLIVSAGKYGSKNYTRLSYKGARSAVK